MIDTTLLTATASLAALGLVSAATLSGWNGWLQLKTRELDQQRGEMEGGASANGMTRIEIADLKERIRKLEAIAAGVDL